MSKRDLKKYLGELTKEQLEEQLVELYEKFAPVKVYYDFVFNPKEDKLIQEAKVKISHEYFPIKKPGAKWRPKAKMRRSVAQKLIKHFMMLGVDSYIVADIMLYNIEIAQKFSSQNLIKQELFYKSFLNSFEQAVNYIVSNGIFNDFKLRINAIQNETSEQKWRNKYNFEAILEKIDY
ncbi:DUF6155 family protein [Flavobacterium nitrogenifigens]|uniref:Uncharacterized protein n=1 Tax=Flavobacterium nitrogenifigens TaxID=1617283 RepID=A0A521BQB9_9FLAO|nr:DUF6155 family protein [Flavobacterium nitrogenifigens]KAF2330759.1 hypothetical protein DM397_13255 [Flavobacterium nitrogenifigens]SMO49333.1 hypothetical protein SAMN06265220_1011238 [Flavobacterium nitrogenifigens]